VQQVKKKKKFQGDEKLLRNFQMRGDPEKGEIYKKKGEREGDVWYLLRREKVRV